MVISLDTWTASCDGNFYHHFSITSELVFIIDSATVLEIILKEFNIFVFSYAFSPLFVVVLFYLFILVLLMLHQKYL